MTRRIIPALLLLTACAPVRSPDPAAAPSPGRMGVLVMAHGGGSEWNAAVQDAVAPLAGELPTAVAYGMANPRTLENALEELASQGVSRVAVVRLFVSGRSFLEQTEYFLGLGRRPERLFLMGRDPSAPEPPPIDHGMDVSTHAEGLMASAEAARILTDRTLALSRSPSGESVMLIAHGMGDEADNERVLEAMAGIAEELEGAGFAHVAVATLREDWAEKRAAAEAHIRGFVEGEGAAGRRVLVVPMRLSGFGPYAEVLAGLEYAPGEGLLPHAEVTKWIRSTAGGVACARGWESPITRCGSPVAAPSPSGR